MTDMTTQPSLRKRMIAALVALLTIGWLVPLWLGVDVYLTFWQLEGLPLMEGRSPGNSFPFLEFARQCFVVTFLWLAAALGAWSYIGFLIVQRANQP